MATIVDAITKVLSESDGGLTSLEIYNKIIEEDLYRFNAASPQAIVSGTLRRHCFGLDFPTASPTKYFRIIQESRGKSKYALYDEAFEYSNMQPVLINEKEKTPEERINDSYQEHICSMKAQLMNAILNSSPAFFEELVVQLLLKMGYGYDGASGKVTQYCKDGGVDGIIEEDRLGLDKIYIQAKRYAIDNKVDTKTVDQFVGVMEKKNIKKGFFITTSSFAKNAVEDYSKPIGGKTIRLIDGEELMTYLIKYEIGVKSAMVYTTYKLDENYFNSI